MSNNRLRVVIDTNVLLVSISPNSKYHWLVGAISNNKFDIYITNEILSEYEEILGRYFNENVVENYIKALIEYNNVIPTLVYFKFDIITDPDDNKFLDCAFASNAHFLVSNDKHFDVLKTTDFPKISLLKLEEFKQMLIEEKLI